MIAAAASAAALAFSVSPVRLTVRAGARAAIAVRAPGTRGAAVTAAPTGYALDLRGRPVVGAARGVWLRLPATHVALRPGGTATIALTAHAPRGAAPGDHPVGLALTLATGARGATLALLRVVVAVVVRVPGAVRRRVVVAALGVDPRRRVLRLVLANRGNVDEALGPRALSVRLRRGSRLAAVFHPIRRRLLAHTRGLFEWRLRPGLHGAFSASVVVAHGGPTRTFPLRL